MATAAARATCAGRRHDREIRELEERRDRLDDIIVIATVPGACTTG
ncbi:hypothetical protein [Symbioplanes lichenis]|nr:hypothetical protein [Actinoplanes lichenis]